VVFSNSPPVCMTKNGKAYSSACGISNLDREKDQMFADYIVKTLKHFDEEKIKVDFISPVNEPEWGWCRKDNQEGCPYLNDQIADIARRTGAGLAENQLTTQVMVPESGLLLFANSRLRFKPGRQNQIKDFFSDHSKNHIGGNKNTADIICAHGYFTEWPLWLMRHVRSVTADKCRRYGLRYWMSEYCILRKTREIDGGGRDPGMPTALYISRVIHHDLVYGNASAWCWWLGISAADFKDGLTYINSDGTGLIDTKTLWALGNFSQFIRPGAARIEVKGRHDKKFFVSAYRNQGSEELIFVIINMKPEMQSLEIRGLPDGKTECWETSETSSLKKIKPAKNGNSLMVSPLSVTTFIVSK
jgi:O-glycosyl hydrolase